MEFNPKEAAKVNIFGTFNLARVAVAQGVEKVVMISTDKAVRPTSVMGATKRMAEYICRAFNGRSETELMSHAEPVEACVNEGSSFDKLRMTDGVTELRMTDGVTELRTTDGVAESRMVDGVTEFGMTDGVAELRMTDEVAESGMTADGRKRTRFVSVRFGNVLGSRGSVLPLFLDQLKHGGPLTVTHSEMKRYFMTIPEAVSLVLQASILGNGGEVFVLDMGEPVHIVEVAEELIRLHGLEPYKDIDIQFTGLRPGEKLFEEILTAEEGTDASRHEKIYIARNDTKYSLTDLQGILPEFAEVIADPSPESKDRMKLLLRKYVKYYANE